MVVHRAHQFSLPRSWIEHTQTAVKTSWARSNLCSRRRRETQSGTGHRGQANCQGGREHCHSATAPGWRHHNRNTPVHLRVWVIEEREMRTGVYAYDVPEDRRRRDQSLLSICFKPRYAERRPLWRVFDSSSSTSPSTSSERHRVHADVVLPGSRARVNGHGDAGLRSLSDQQGCDCPCELARLANLQDARRRLDGEGVHLATPARSSKARGPARAASPTIPV